MSRVRAEDRLTYLAIPANGNLPDLVRLELEGHLETSEGTRSFHLDQENL